MSGLTCGGDTSALFEFGRISTNLSVVRVCQKVRGAVDDVDLSVGIPQEVVELLCNCRWCWYVLLYGSTLSNATNSVKLSCSPP